jgi:hypothetical protein
VPLSLPNATYALTYDKILESKAKMPSSLVPVLLKCVLNEGMACGQQRFIVSSSRGPVTCDQVA